MLTRRGINIRKIATILAVLLPLFDIYSFPFIFNGLSAFFQFVLIIIMLIVNKKNDTRQNVKARKQYLRYMIYFVLAVLISMILNFEVGFNYRKLLSFIFILLILYESTESKLDSSFFITFYIMVALFCVLFGLVQTVAGNFFGVVISQRILPLQTVGSIYNAMSDLSNGGFYRAPSFFSEPASFAQYLIPALCMLLFLYGRVKKKKYIVGAIFISAGIMISTSFLGIVLMGVLWIIFLHKNNKKNFIKFIFGIIVLFAISFFIVRTNDFLFQSFTKLLNNFDPTNGKISERVFRGFAVYFKLPAFNKIFGVGLGNAEYYITSLNISTIYDSRWYTTYDYFNTASSSLIFGGIAGGICFLLAQLSIIRYDKEYSRMLSIAFIIMIFASSMFFNTMFIFYGVTLIIFEGSFSSSELAIQNEQRGIRLCTKKLV